MAYVSDRKIAVLPVRDDEFGISIDGNFEIIK